MTAEAEQRKARPRRAKRWTAEEFDIALRDQADDEAVAISQRIRGWATERGLKLTWGSGSITGTYYPKLDHAGRIYPTFAVYTDSRIEINFRDIADANIEADTVTVRHQIAVQLGAVRGEPFPDEQLKTWAYMPLLALSSDAALCEFLATWDWYIDLVTHPAQPDS